MDYVLNPVQAQVSDFVEEALVCALVYSPCSRLIIVGLSLDGVLVLVLDPGQLCREMLGGFVPVLGVPRLPGLSLLAGDHALVLDLADTFADIFADALLLLYLPSAAEIHP